jgi:hypothetical protein
MIVVLLTLIACRQGSPTTVLGAAPREYKVVHNYRGQDEALFPDQIQTMLNKQAKEGWELVAAPTGDPEGYFIFKK